MNGGSKLKDIFEDVYDSARGELVAEYRFDWVQDQFLPGGDCAYNRMMDAYARLRERLGVQEEDADVEIMRDCQNRITYLLCKEMFRCGRVYQQILQDG
jgi:hypothetical protein